MQKRSSPTVKVALVTGAARRIGAEIASILHENGMNVVIHYHFSARNAKKLCNSLNEKRANSAITLKANLFDHAQLTPLVTDAKNAWGRLDVLINNASCFYKTPVGKIPETTWEHVINTNLRAPFFLAQLAAPYLAKQSGSIVNIVDIHAERPMQNFSIYSISKAGLNMLTKSLACELGPKIRVNSVSPGPIIWPEGKSALSASLKHKIIQSTLLKRHGNPLEIAKAVLFLVRDADFITGQDIAVDGGRSLVMA